MYMNPNPNRKYDREKRRPRWIHGVDGLLRSWNGRRWHKQKWLSAFNYQEDAWYTVEIQKSGGQLIMRAFCDGESIPSTETSPVSLNAIYGMGRGATEHEWAYVGEPHVDSYEGSAQIDEISMWTNSTDSK